MQEAAPVPGYVCLVSQTHAVDLHDLPEAVASAFMRDARKVSMALATITGAVKMNYEIHATQYRTYTCTSSLGTVQTNLKGNPSTQG